MSFLDRFNGRTSFMNKEGVVGIVAQKGNPIDKTPASSQMNYYKPTNTAFNSTNDERFRPLSIHTRDEFHRDDLPKQVYSATPQYSPEHRRLYGENNMDAFNDVQRSMDLNDYSPSVHSATRSKSTKVLQPSNNPFQPSPEGIYIQKPASFRQSNQINLPNMRYQQNEGNSRQYGQQQDPNYHSPQLPSTRNQKPQVRNHVVQQNILRNNAPSYDLNPKYQLDNPNVARYKEYAYYNGGPNQQGGAYDTYDQRQSQMMPDTRQQYSAGYSTSHRFGGKSDESFDNQLAGGRQTRNNGQFMGLEQSYEPQLSLYKGNSDHMPRGNTTNQYFSTTNRNDEQESRTASQAYRPYTLKEYKTLQTDSTQVRRGGLGPNTYSDDWVKKKEKSDKMTVFAERVRISHNKNLPVSEMRKPRTEESGSKPSYRFNTHDSRKGVQVRVRNNQNDNYHKNQNTSNQDNDGYMAGIRLGKQEKQQLKYLNTIDQGYSA